MEQQNQHPTEEKTENKPPIKTNWKFIAIVVVSAFLTVGGILLLRGFQQEIPKQTLPPPAPSPQSQQFIPGQEVTIQGLVVENSLGCINDQGHKLCISDGPLHFLIRDNRNREIRVVYHYGEWSRCLNNEIALQAKQLKESDEVDVFAKVVSENEVSTCDSQAYYIKQLGPDSNTDTSTWQTYRNEEFGFEVKYPPAFFYADSKVPPFSNTTIGSVFEVDFSPNEYQGKRVEHSLIRISVIPTIVSPSQFIELVDNTAQAKSLYNKTFVLPGYETREIRSLDTFSSVQAIQFERMYGSGGYTALHTLVQNSAKAALFDIVLEKSSTSEIPQSLHNQILSTFRFVE